MEQNSRGLHRCWWRMLETTLRCWWPILYLEKVIDIRSKSPRSWNGHRYEVTNITVADTVGSNRPWKKRNSSKTFLSIGANNFPSTFWIRRNFFFKMNQSPSRIFFRNCSSYEIKFTSGFNCFCQRVSPTVNSIYQTSWKVLIKFSPLESQK